MERLFSSLTQLDQNPRIGLRNLKILIISQVQYLGDSIRLERPLSVGNREKMPIMA